MKNRGVGKTANINIRVSPGRRKLFQRRCEDYGISQSEALDLFIRAFIARDIVFTPAKMETNDD